MHSGRGYHGSNPGVLVCRPATIFLETLHKHSNKEYHKVAIVRAEEFEGPCLGHSTDAE